MSLAALVYPGFDPIAFSVGPLQVRWYGLAYLAGFFVAAALLRYFSKRWDIELTWDDVTTILLWAVFGVLVGGRLGYVLFYGDGYYLKNPIEILAVWDGGMSFHGGLIGILLAGIPAARAVGVTWLTLCDLGAIGAPVGFGLGRLANFVNGELWGRVSDVSWAMVFPGAGVYPRHPSQLYEAVLEGLVLFAVMVVLARKLPPRPRGEMVGWLLALYGCFRISAEFFREPDTQLGFLAGDWMTMGMLLSLPLVIGGFWLVTWARRRQLGHVRVGA